MMVGLVVLATASVLFGDALAEDSDTCALLQQTQRLAVNPEDAPANLVQKKKEDTGREWCSWSEQTPSDYIRLCERALDEENCMSIGFFCSWYSFNGTATKEERSQNIGKRAVQFKELGCSSLPNNVKYDEVCPQFSDEGSCTNMWRDCQWHYSATVVTTGVKTARGPARVKEWCSSKGQKRKTCGRAMSEEKCEQDCVWNTAKGLRRTKAKKKKKRGSEEWCSSASEKYATLCGSARCEKHCMEAYEECNWYYKTSTGTVVKKQRWDAAKTKKD